MSLAAQLSRIAGPDAALLAAAKGSAAKSRASILFAGAQAAQLTRNDILGMASAALERLCALEPSFESYSALFQDSEGNNSDLTEIQAAELSETLATFVLQLGPHMTRSDAAKVLEWLIRRYSVQELAPVALVQACLPYAETQMFVRLLDMIPERTLQKSLGWLKPIKSAGLGLPMPLLVSAMSHNDALQFVCKIPLSHGIYITTWAAALCSFLSTAKLTASEMAAVMASLKQCFRSIIPQCHAAGVMVILALAQSSLSSYPRDLKKMLLWVCKSGLSERDIMRSVICLLHSQNITSIPDKVTQALPRNAELVIEMANMPGISNYINIFASSMDEQTDVFFAKLALSAIDDSLLFTKLTYVLKYSVSESIPLLKQFHAVRPALFKECLQQSSITADALQQLYEASPSMTMDVEDAAQVLEIKRAAQLAENGIQPIIDLSRLTLAGAQIFIKCPALIPHLPNDAFESLVRSGIPDVALSELIAFLTGPFARSKDCNRVALDIWPLLMTGKDFVRIAISTCIPLKESFIRFINVESIANNLESDIAHGLDCLDTTVSLQVLDELATKLQIASPTEQCLILNVTSKSLPDLQILDRGEFINIVVEMTYSSSSQVSNVALKCFDMATRSIQLPLCNIWHQVLDPLLKLYTKLVAQPHTQNLVSLLLSRMGDRAGLLLLRALTVSSTAQFAARHLAAFVQATNASMQIEDFQVALPFILVAISTKSLNSEEGQSLLGYVAAILSNTYVRTSHIFGYETLYGPRTDLQYLKREELLDILRSLTQPSAHVSFAERIEQLPAQLAKPLMHTCLAHVPYWPTNLAEKLLEIFSIRHVMKLQTALGLLRKGSSGVASIKAFDASAIPVLEKDGEVWDLFKDLLNRSEMQEHLLKSDLVLSLSIERQRNLIEHILLRDITMRPSISDIAASQVLDTILGPYSLDTLEPAAKKSRTHVVEHVLNLKHAKVLVEWVAALTYQPSSAVLTSLFGYLQTIKTTDAWSNQLCLTIFNRVTEIHYLRVDVLLTMLRADDVTIVDGTLDLLAKLGKESPDQVVPALMPIFTFMGTDQSTKDNNLSFNILQKTVQVLVPIALQANTEIATLLRLFTQAYHHIPKHRRVPLMDALVSAIGPSHLGALISSLALKVLLRVHKMQREAIRESLESYLMIMSLRSPDEQLMAVQAFVNQIAGDPVTVYADGRGDLSIADLKEMEAHFRAGLVVLSSLVLQNLNSQACDTDIKLSVVVTSTKTILAMAQYPAMGLQTLTHAFAQLMTVQEFADLIVTLLKESHLIAEHALELLSHRMQLVKKAARSNLCPAVIDAFGRATALLSGSRNAGSIVKSIGKLATHVIPEELNQLQTCMAAVLNTIVASRVETLRIMIVKLGPRCLPQLEALIKLTQNSKMDERLLLSITIVSTLHHFLLPHMQILIDNLLTSPFEETGPQAGLLRALLKLPKKTVVQELAKHEISDGLQLRWSLKLMANLLQQVSQEEAIHMAKHVFKLMQKFVQRCADLPDTPITELCEVFISITIKLNEVTFKPLFTQLQSQAILSKRSEQVVFLNLYLKLVDILQSIVVPYVVPMLNMLQTMAETGEEIALTVLDRVYAFDERNVLDASRSESLGMVLLKRSNTADAQTAKVFSLVLKSMSNSSTASDLYHVLLRSLRTEDTAERIHILHFLNYVWQNIAVEMTPFIAETVSSYLAEYIEDENNDLSDAARKVIKTIQLETGQDLSIHLT